jgi:hypothetical protein
MANDNADDARNILSHIDQSIFDPRQESDISAVMLRFLDAAIEVAGTAKGTLQRLDAKDNCL